MIYVWEGGVVVLELSSSLGGAPDKPDQTRKQHLESERKAEMRNSKVVVLRRLSIAKVFVLILGVSMVSPSALATNWIAATGDWNNPANWTLGEPTSSATGYVNNGGTVQITQPGELCNILEVGSEPNDSGSVELQSGGLSVREEIIGYRGTGRFTQSGGTNGPLGTDTLDVYVGFETGSDGIYKMLGGELTARYLLIGGGSSGRGGRRSNTKKAGGTFIQSGGTVSAEVVTVGTGVATYLMSGGQLHTNGLEVGGSFGGSGARDATLLVTDPGVEIIVSHGVNFYGGGTFMAVEGTTIRFAPLPGYYPYPSWTQGLMNWNTNPAELPGLKNTRFLFANGTTGTHSLRLLSKDLGAIPDGFKDNFALGTLQLGDETEPGTVSLGGHLYVDTLILNQGSILNVKGYNLYYKTLTDNGAQINLDGGAMVQVSQPAPTAGR